MTDNTSQAGGPEKHTAGALDIRNIIGGLLGTYGVILVLMGLFGDKELEKTGDVNANLWAGLVMAAMTSPAHRLALTSPVFSSSLSPKSPISTRITP